MIRRGFKKYAQWFASRLPEPRHDDSTLAQIARIDLSRAIETYLGQNENELIMRQRCLIPLSVSKPHMVHDSSHKIEHALKRNTLNLQIVRIRIKHIQAGLDRWDKNKKEDQALRYAAIKHLHCLKRKYSPVIPAVAEFCDAIEKVLAPRPSLTPHSFRNKIANFLRIGR